MSEWNEYHKVTSKIPPRKNIVNFINNHKELYGKAIDIGCGAGNDTIYLIQNNWNVLAIDGTDVENSIKEKLNDEEKEKFSFQVQKFEELKLPKSDLIISNNALPFCNKEHFYTMWQEICNSINSNGFFVGNLFGINDEWNTPKDKRTFLNKEQVIDLFKDFEVISLKEFEKDRTTALGIMKHWHTFEVIAKKK